jgi:hypothetical protein
LACDTVYSMRIIYTPIRYRSSTPSPNPEDPEDGISWATPASHKYPRHQPYISNGCSDEYVYQSFEPRFSSMTALQVTVVGYTIALDCEPATYYNLHDLNNDGTGAPAIEIHYGDCEFNAHFPPNLEGVFGIQPVGTVRFAFLYSAPGFSPGHCNSLSLDANRLVFFSATIQYTANNTYENGTQKTSAANPDLSNIISTVFVCNTKHQQVQLDIAQNDQGYWKVSHQTYLSTYIYGKY